MLAENLDEITKHMVPTALGRLQKLRDARVVDPLQAPVLDAMEAHVVSSASTYNVAQVCEPPGGSPITQRPLAPPRQCEAWRCVGAFRARTDRDVRVTIASVRTLAGWLVLGERELQASLLSCC